MSGIGRDRTDLGRHRRSSPAAEFIALLSLEWKLARHLLPLRIAMALIPIALMIFLRPVMDLLVPNLRRPDGGATSQGLEFSAPGLTIILCFVNLQFFCWSAYDEHGYSTWNRLRAGFVQPVALLGAKVVFMWGYLVAMFACTFVAGTAMGMELRGSVVGWAASAVVISGVASLYGLMLYVLLPTGNLFIIISHAGSLIMLGFAGGIVPSNYLPHWMQAIATYLPQYWAVRSFKAVSLTSANLLAIAPELLVLACFGLVFLSIAAWRFDPEALKRPLSE